MSEESSPVRVPMNGQIHDEMDKLIESKDSRLSFRSSVDEYE